MKRFVKYLTMLTLAVALTSGCCGIKKLQELKIESYRLESVSPKGFTAVDADLVLTVDNPGNEFSVKALECLVYRSGRPFCVLTSDDISVLGKQESVCRLPLHAKLSAGVNIMTFLELLQGSLDDFTVDVNLEIKIKGGPKLKVSEKGIPFKDLSQMLKNYSKI